MKTKLLVLFYLFILSGCMTINEETVKNYDSEKLCEFSNPWKWVTTKREEEIIDSELCNRGKYCCNENERTSIDDFEGKRNWGQKKSKENKEQSKENNTVTSQVFADTIPLYKLNSKDLVFVSERCAANSLAISIMISKINNKNAEQLYKKKYEEWVLIATKLLSKKKIYASEGEVLNHVITNVLSLQEQVSKDMDKFYLSTGKALSGYVADDMDVCNKTLNNIRSRFSNQ